MTDEAKTEQEKQALVTSLRLLAATPKSRKMLRQKLEAKGFGGGVIEKVLERLEGEGVLDDRVFAQSVFQSYATGRRSGRKRIAFELEKRGIADSLIGEVLAQYPPEEEREKALELAQEKWERWNKLDLMKRRKKIYSMLVRRGFDFALSREVIGRVERERQS